MSRGINKAVIVGTLGKDPEIRYAQNGNAVVNVSVATNEFWKNRDDRLHDRFLYERDGEVWRVSRLYP